MGDISIKPGENAIMSCEIFGYPASSVVWSFIPCNKPEFDINSCDESKKLVYVSLYHHKEISFGFGFHCFIMFML